MPLVSLAMPPGIYKNGTERQSAGRYFDGNLVRFYEGTIRPWGGWRLKSTSALTGVGRAMHAWKDNGGVSYAAIGTESNLYVMNRAGVVTDITPVGLEAGYPIATVGGGYGSGNYGVDTYGTPRADTTLTLDATMWTVDNRGANLVGTCWTDGKLYEWAPGDLNAAQIANSPGSCRAVVMTPERFVMALGANGDPRSIAWCDQEDETDWTPTDTNQAGSFPLQTGGRLMQARAARDYTMILTDLDAWTANYLGFPLVYGFTKVGSGCGAISQGCLASLDTQAVWMGQSGFFACNGSFVQPLPCDVQDFVFGNINRQQQSLVTCRINSDFGEVIWHYPSTNALEVDSYVVWNYRENHWSVGTLQRLSGVDRGIFQYPLDIDASGNIYEHEVGIAYSGLVPFLRGGPLEIANGDNVGIALQIIPDENTTGAVNIRFRTRFYPQGDETLTPFYTASAMNDVRFTGRQIEVEYQMNGLQDFRIGNVRLDMRQGGGR